MYRSLVKPYRSYSNRDDDSSTADNKPDEIQFYGPPKRYSDQPEENGIKVCYYISFRNF